MNYTKTVLMPIDVPDCGYCREPGTPYRICEHFDNEGGHPTCEINLGSLKYADDGGVRKPVGVLHLLAHPSPFAVKRSGTPDSGGRSC